jgi:hypothetical protein
MAKIIVYDDATGSIKRLVTCPSAYVTSQIKTGEAQIARPSDFSGNHTTHRVVDGEVVPIE